MTNEEINKALHVALGKCWHKYHEVPHPPELRNVKVRMPSGRVYSTGTRSRKCKFCNFSQGIVGWNNPDYCTDLNAAAEVEKFVVEKVGRHVYTDNLADVCNVDLDDSFDVYCDAGVLILATAEQRARACLAALQEQKQ